MLALAALGAWLCGRLGLGDDVACGKEVTGMARFELVVEETVKGVGSTYIEAFVSLPEARGAWRAAVRERQRQGFRLLQRLPRDIRELLSVRGGVVQGCVAYMAKGKERALVYVAASDEG